MARFSRPTAETPTRIALIADPHIPRKSVETLKLTMPTTFLERAIVDINARSVDATLFLGDLTMDGREAEYERFDEVVADLEGPWLCIPGNHDLEKGFDDHESPNLSEFASRYASEGIPFVVRHGDVDVVGLDSVSADEMYNSHSGMVDTDQLSWLDDRLSEAENPVVAFHHILPPIVEQFDEYRDRAAPDLSRPSLMKDPSPLIETLAAHNVPLVLSGHLHIPSLGEVDGIHEVNGPSTGTFPPAYLLLDVGPDGAVVRYVTLGDVAEVQTAFTERSEYRPKARALASMAAARTASFPLVDDPAN
jgi:3',5'-cyclic AMP phosphodiesterase CpdA